MNNSVNNKAHELGEKMREGAQKTIDKMEEKYDQTANKAIEIREATNKFIKENPEKSLLIAAGIGMVTTLLAISFLRRR